MSSSGKVLLLKSGGSGEFCFLPAVRVCLDEGGAIYRL